MITCKYIIAGRQRKSRFYLKPDALATGFIDSAERFYQRDNAQAAADRENASKVWGFTWSVFPQAFDVMTGKALEPHV